MDQVRENPLDLLIRKIRTHHPLSREDQAAILNLPFKLRYLEAQSYTIREGDRPDRCAVLLSGFAYRHKVTGDGSRQIMALHIPGEALDFQNMFLSESDHNVQMLTRGQVAEIPREPLEKLVLDNPDVGRAVMIFTLVEASIFREWVLNIGRRDARSRIAHVLCEFAYRRVKTRRDHGRSRIACFSRSVTETLRCQRLNTVSRKEMSSNLAPKRMTSLG